ncbi:MAG: class A beta-lactamase-related serine hydrolase [Gemmatimonadota bacterium]|nr:class A beta-lactamase-related serine hydrolase [Gemmatimonadota bacterium]
MRRSILPALLLALTAAPLLSTACAATPTLRQVPERVVLSDTAALRRTLEGITADYPGTVGISLRNLRTGETLSLRGSETFPSASLIKLSVLVTLLDEVQAGRMRLEEPITLLARDRVGGSGVLQHMASGHTLSVEDAARLMIIISDNTATNLLLDKLDIRTTWSKMEALGLPHTKIHSKTFRRHTSVAMDSSVKYGLGVTTPDEIVQLFTLLHQGRAVSPAMDSLALEILKGTEDGERLRRWLPAGTRVAHKSGSVDRARNDCGILYGTEAPVALCVMTREDEDLPYTVDSRANLLIARIAREVFRHHNPSTPLPSLPTLSPPGPSD